MASAVNLKELTPIELDRLSIEKGEVLAEEWRGGLYKCAGCQNTLYRSLDKFRARGSWPAFRKAATENESVEIQEDFSFGLQRKEILCKKCGLHVGHLFADGKPAGDVHPEAGNRHCVLSIVLEFSEDPSIPATVPQTLEDNVRDNFDSESESEEVVDTKPTTSATEPKKTSSTTSSTDKPKTKRPKKPRRTEKPEEEEEGSSSVLSYATPVLILAATGLIVFSVYKYVWAKKNN